MYQYTIIGGHELKGEISVYGDKNTALKLIPATILAANKCTISNIPDITDITTMMEIMKDLGAKIKKIKTGQFEFDTKPVRKTTINPLLARKLRASTVLMGPLLARFKKVSIPHPGGCVIGKRPIDIHLDAFKKLGAKISIKDSYYHIVTKNLKGTKIIPHSISVTGTENIMMAAAMAQGKTTIEYCACEPSIVALADFLNQMGADIRQAGSPKIIINGQKQLHGANTTVISDRLETGTFIILGALCAKELVIKNCQPNHLEVFLEIIKKAGVKIKRSHNQIVVYRSKHLKPNNITTNAYPGFPTDLQAPYTLLMTQADGVSMIHETIFEGRLNYIEWLNTMGANITLCDPHRAIVSGPTPLVGKKIVSPDIRAGMTLIIAGLMAKGKSQIDNIDLVDRGYTNLDQRLKEIGARITRKKI